MKIDAKLTDAALLSLIGARLAGVRVAANLTQEQLAEQAGADKRGHVLTINKPSVPTTEKEHVERDPRLGGLKGSCLNT